MTKKTSLWDYQLLWDWKISEFYFMAGDNVSELFRTDFIQASFYMLKCPSFFRIFP